MWCSFNSFEQCICKGSNVGWFKWSFVFRNFDIINFYFVIAMSYLVHNVEAIFYLRLPLTSSGNLF